MSEGASNLLAELISEFEYFAQPLEDSVSRSGGLYDFLAGRGWNFTALKSADLSAFAGLVGTFQQSIADLKSLQSFEDLQGIAKALGDLGQALAQLQSIRDTLAAAASIQLTSDQAEALAADVAEGLLFAYLRQRMPLTFEVLLALTLIEEDTAALLLDPGGTILRYPVRRPALRMDRLAPLLGDPLSHLRAIYLPANGLADEAATIDVATRIFSRLEALVFALGGQAMAGLREPSINEIASPAYRRSFTFAFVPPSMSLGDGATALASQVGSTLVIVPADGRASDNTAGPALEVVPFGLAAFGARLGSWTAALTTAGTSSPIVITRQGVRFSDPAAGRFAVELGLSKGQAGLPALVIGGTSGTRLQIDRISLHVEFAVDATSQDYGVLVDLHDAALIVSGGDGDGFIRKVLPNEGVRIDLDLALGWSNRKGLYFRGGAGLEATLPVNIDLLGILRIPAVHLALQVGSPGGEPGVRVTVATTVKLAIGPVTAVIERFGLDATLGFPAAGGNLAVADLSLGFQPPKGAGLSIDAGPVSGGGYLFFDTAAEQYGGIVQLSIKKTIALNAIALLTTRLPGLPEGQKGFSLLLIITGEFPPLPLGFGFTLNGVGGLIGINRTMMLEPLRDSVRDRSIEGILFPKDPLANATSLIAALQRIFPPAEGRFVFGPMVKVGWGPTQLITIEAALLLELPSPLRLVLLGRMRAVLPDRSAAVVDLRLDVVGILDFDRREASIDASFVDSRLAGFTLTGDMALRLGWGATKAFALAAGGFNPRFSPPPSFPVLRRLALSLSDSENPRFRLESYLALTSNTIQFGARAELSAKVETAIGEFGAAAMIFFDALIELEPFGFIVDLGATIEVTLGGRPLIQAQLLATLSGTKPWHVVGFVEVVFFGRHRIPFEASVGDQAPTSLPTIDLLPKLAEAIARHESWATVPPAEAAGMVVLRDAGATGAALLHPLGRVALRQRLLPFGKRLSRFGSATPAGGATMFSLSSLVIAGRTEAVAPLLDDFAPGQYDALSEDEKLALPAFEQMQAGGEGAAGLDIRLPDPGPGGVHGTHVAIDYQELVIDRLDGPSRKPRRRKKPVMAIGLIAAMADDGLSAEVEFTGPRDRAVAVPGERWRAADADQLAALPGGSVGSAAEARDWRAASGRPADQTTVIALHEAA